MSLRESAHGYWSSPLTFVIAASGAVIGLGNIWRLPYLAGSHGGSAFLLVYALALIFMALPLFIAELVVGRRARINPVSGVRLLAAEARSQPSWAVIGWLALVGATLVLSYYSVIAGWSMAYVFRAADGMFRHANRASVTKIFATLVQSPERVLGWHTIFMVMITIIVSHGVNQGLERGARYMVPGAFALVVILWCYALDHGNMGAAMHYLFAPRFGELGWSGVFEALNEAFFTLGLGAGVMLAMGAYLREEYSPVWTAMAVVVLDFVFALVAGMAVFALLFASGEKPAQTVALAFQSVPLALSGLPGGLLATVIFYLLLLLVGLTTATLLMEPVVMWLIERLGMTRVTAAGATGITIWFLGLGDLFSFNLWAQVTLLGKTYYEWLEWLTAHFLLPLTGLLICIFVARIMPVSSVREGWGRRYGVLLPLWLWLLRYPARIGLIVVMCYALGLIGISIQLW